MSTVDPDQLPDAELLDAALAAARSDATDEGDVRWLWVRALHRRPTQAVFESAVTWCSGSNVVERALGADVLAQLGPVSGDSPRPFATESVVILSRLLSDPQDKVVMSALYALGHLDAGDPALIASLSKHASPDVRHAVAYSLGGRSDVVSVRALIDLSGDSDEDVRDWATFALGSLCEVESPEVLESLAARLSDEHADVRGEALVGLAVRGDRRALPHVIAALKSGSAGSLIYEAAEALITRYPDEGELRAAIEPQGH